MLTSLLLKTKARLAPHLEVRDIRVGLHSQLESNNKTLAIIEKHKAFLTSPNSTYARGLYSGLSNEAGISQRLLYTNLVEGLKSTSERLTGLIDLYDSARYKVLASSNLSAINANALQLAAICDFYSKFSRSLALCVTELESLNLRKDDVPKVLNNYITRTFSKERMSSMGSIIDYNANNKRKDIVKVIVEMDDVEVTRETLEAAKALGGSEKLDPAGFNYLNVFNPKFWTYCGFKAHSELRLMYLDSEKAELLMLEIRYQELVQLKETGNIDMATDKTINKLKDTIDITRYNIKEIEESMG